MKPLMRHKARVRVLQALYEWLIAQNKPNEVELHILAECKSDNIDLQYFKELFHGIVKEIDSLDELISPQLDRPLKDLSPIELLVLRLAVYELKFRLDIPYRVVINEALEITKKFGSIEGFKYVNGVLDKVAKEIRKDEMKSAK